MTLAKVRIPLLLTIVTAVFAQPASSPGKARGVPIAAIRIEVFSDFECPACKVFHEQTLKPLIAEYVDKGKVYLRHYDFPLPMHPYAREAACYACAAGRVGKYERVADTLYARQEVWSKDGKIDEAVSSVLSPDEAKKVRVLAKSPEIAAEIDGDIQKGRQANLRQTPTMILTHNSKTYPISGAVTYPILHRFIDQLLTQ